MVTPSRYRGALGTSEDSPLPSGSGPAGHGTDKAWAERSGPMESQGEPRSSNRSSGKGGPGLGRGVKGQTLGNRIDCLATLSLGPDESGRTSLTVLPRFRPLATTDARGGPLTDAFSVPSSMLPAARSGWRPPSGAPVVLEMARSHPFVPLLAEARLIRFRGRPGAPGGRAAEMPVHLGVDLRWI